MCEPLASPRWQALSEAGAQVQGLLWASTGTKDPAAADTLYAEALAAPRTINTLPALADHGVVNTLLPVDGGDAEATLAAFEEAGANLTALAAELQRAGAASFTKSWQGLLACLAAKDTS